MRLKDDQRRAVDRLEELQEKAALYRRANPLGPCPFKGRDDVLCDTCSRNHNPCHSTPYDADIESACGEVSRLFHDEESR